MTNPSMTTASRVIGLFAKWPAPGRVKTRLAAETSPEWAAQVARAFLLDLLDRLAPLTYRRLLAFAPPEAAAGFAEIAAGRFELVPQSDGDLGRRMATFLQRQLDAGAEAVVLLGSDSPHVPVELIDQAFRELAANDVVLGPAADGGYYLLGIARRLPPIFADIPWGTSQVLARTLACLEHRRHALLLPWFDVDTLADFRQLQADIRDMVQRGIDPELPRTRALAEPEISA